MLSHSHHRRWAESETISQALYRPPGNDRSSSVPHASKDWCQLIQSSSHQCSCLRHGSECRGSLQKMGNHGDLPTAVGCQSVVLKRKSNWPTQDRRGESKVVPTALLHGSRIRETAMSRIQDVGLSRSLRRPTARRSDVAPSVAPTTTQTREPVTKPGVRNTHRHLYRTQTR